MDKFIDLIVNSLPAWLAILVLVVYFVGGKELIDRFWKRDEREITKKRAELELAKMELEEKELKKTALEKGIYLSALESGRREKYSTPLSKTVVWCSIPIALILVFMILPISADTLQKNPNTDLKTVLVFVMFVLSNAFVSVLIPVLMRGRILEEILQSCLAIAIFLGTFAITGSMLSILSSLGILK